MNYIIILLFYSYYYCHFIFNHVLLKQVDKSKNINDVENKDVMNTAFLGLGGNMGNRLANLSSAIFNIEKICGRIIKTSSIYETDAWGTNSNNKYLNQVVKLNTNLNALALLKKLNTIEEKAGRKRTHNKYADRTIDIDILFFNDEIITKKNLYLPHPRLHLRKFVLVPLNEIEKELLHPVFKKSAAQLLKTSGDKTAIKLYEADIALRYICIEGNIGSGKSTLAKSLAKKLNTIYLPENFEKNHLLPLFYSNPKLYSFPLEYSFLINRFESMKSCFENAQGLVISDFSIYKSLWFAKVNLPKKEFLLFKKHFDAFTEHLREPDLIIYLKTSENNLIANINNRGRPYEKDISKKYLKSVDKQYKKGITQFGSKKVLNMSITKYTSDLESKCIKSIENYITKNFG